MSTPGSSRRLAPEFRVRVNGSDLPPAAVADLITAEVVEDVDAASMFSLRLINWDMMQLEVTWADDDLFAEGKQIELLMGYVDGLERLMVGEVTGLEPEFASGAVPTVTVRGYDVRHRLLRGRKTRSFTLLKDSEIASQIASEYGLSADATDTGVTFDYVLQHNQSDLHFLLERARRIGYEVVVADKTLQFRPRPVDGGAALTLTLEDLLEFHPRLTTMGQVSQLSVRGWSVKDKSAVVGNAAASGTVMSMGGSTSGPSASENAFGATATTAVDLTVTDHAEADQIARGRLNEIALGYITAEGACAGRTDLRSGSVVEITGLGRRFSGRYYVTATRHSYRPNRGYRTEFTGAEEHDMMDLQPLTDWLDRPDTTGRYPGVVVGIVTNNQDPDGLGRVKIRLPWLTDGDESPWARVASPMAGNQRGLYCLPEVDDEVLVAFEHGRIDHPYVLGALWNGKDALPESNSDGKNARRSLTSRSGHIIRLDDSDGQESIVVVDKTGKNQIMIKSSDNSITIAADGDVTIQCSQGKLTLSGMGIELNSKAGFKVHAEQDVALEATGQMNIKGQMVNIN